MNTYAIFYIVMAFVLIIGLGIQLVPRVAPPSQEHYIGANMTITNNTYTCTCTWLGGWDYDSFFGDILVNGVNVGHVPFGTILYKGKCKNITVEAYERSVQSYVTVYRYIYTGEV